VYKVRDALALCSTRQIAFSDPEDPFLNINTAADIAAAEHFIARKPAKT
jgi:molybdopterin-guanine dinucleotide biosynthesis protein A